MSEGRRFSHYIEAIAVPEWQHDAADTIALRVMAVADAEQQVYASGNDRLVAEVERLTRSLAMREGMLRDAEAKIARVEHVRARLLDPTATVTEGPRIARIKADSWLRSALDGDA